MLAHLSPVTDTSTVSTARATFTGCRFVSNTSNKTSIDPLGFLRQQRTQLLRLGSCWQPYNPNFHGAELVPRLWESLRFPRLAGSDTKIIIQRLKLLICKDCMSKMLSYHVRIHEGLTFEREGCWGFPSISNHAVEVSSKV